MEDAVAAVVAQVVGVVEPLTRFDRSSLATRAGTTETASAAARQRFVAEYRAESSRGTGALPGGVRALGGAAAVRAHLGAFERGERTALSGRLRDWLARHGADPRARVAAADCLAEAAPVGWSWRCETCGGAGSVQCATCRGMRTVQCGGCGGSGRSSCSSCGGAGRKSCSGCGGTGAVWQAVLVQKSFTNSSGQQEPRSEWEQQRVGCGMCGGRGTLGCDGCGSSGKLTCSTCGATGTVNCMTCGATGSVACGPCAATGTRHEVSRLRCDVIEKTEIAPSSPRAEVTATLEKLSIADLADMASLEPGRAETGDAHAEREFAARIAVTAVTIDAAGRSFEILGYGSPPRVRDFKNVVGALLENDLADLESAVRATWRLSLRPSRRIARPLAGFLASEANARIADVAIGSSSKYEDRRGAVSQDYADRATKALRGAVSRLHWSGAWLVVLVFLAIPFPVFRWLTPVVVGMRDLDGVPPAAVAGAALVAILVLDWLAKRRVRTACGAERGDAVVAALKRSGSLKARRVVLAVAAAAGIVVGFFAAIKGIVEANGGIDSLR